MPLIDIPPLGGFVLGTKINAIIRWVPRETKLDILHMIHVEGRVP
jgi:hypothetical protein